MSFVATLLLSTLPQVYPGGDLQLPPPKAGAPAPKQDVRPLSEIERFRRDLQELQGPDSRVEARLREMADGYAPPAMEALVLDVARSARATEMQALMVAVRRFSARSAKVGDELLFQLLARPLGEATRPVVETMAVVKGDGAKAALRECVRGRVPAARRHATDLLATMLTPEDLPFAIELSREQSLDLQLRSVDLLRASAAPPAADRLVELLSKDPALAGATCDALVQMRAVAVPALQRLLRAPAIDRGQAYAAFALARIAEHEPTALPDDVGPTLTKRLGEPDALTRSLVAVPLADLLYRGAPGLGAIDAEVVTALIEVVQPLQFVLNIDLLRGPAEQRLQRATGRIVASGEALPWRAWWQDQRADFAAMRARVDVDPANVAQAQVVWRHEGRIVRFLAEGLADVVTMQGAIDVVLSKEQMQDLVQALAAGGFGDEAAMRIDSALPRVRSLQLQVPNGRTQVAMPLVAQPRFDALEAIVQARLDEEVWQLFRDPNTESERGAFWRAERRWRDANPGALDRARRFLGRAVANWAKLTPTLRARAVDHLLANPERKQLLRAEDGERAIEALAQLPALTEIDLRLLEFVATAPGDRAWRLAVDLAARAAGGGPTAVRAVFAGLGPDVVLQALHDERAVVRRAGLAEIMVVRDQRAAGRIVELLADADEDVRVAAAMACGHLQIAAASRPLVDQIVAETTPPEVRRESLRSLGRVGGDLAFQVLQRAVLAKDFEDKEAAMRGLGDLRDPRAAHVLAELVVVGHGRDVGRIAALQLQRQGGGNAIPALRGQLEMVQDQAIRDDLVLLLGAYHDAGSVADLIDLLHKPSFAGRAAALLEGTTGIDFRDAQDRVAVIEEWYRRNKNAPQSQWLLDALRAGNVPTSLRPEHFASEPAQGTVLELTRLLTEAPEPRLWALTGAVLRTSTKQDFGIVTLQSPVDAREAIAARYRLLYEAPRAAQGR